MSNIKVAITKEIVEQKKEAFEKQDTLYKEYNALFGKDIVEKIKKLSNGELDDVFEFKRLEISFGKYIRLDVYNKELNDTMSIQFIPKTETDRFTRKIGLQMSGSSSLWTEDLTKNSAIKVLYNLSIHKPEIDKEFRKYDYASYDKKEKLEYEYREALNDYRDNLLEKYNDKLKELVDKMLVNNKGGNPFKNFNRYSIFNYGIKEVNDKKVVFNERISLLYAKKRQTSFKKEMVGATLFTGCIQAYNSILSCFEVNRVSDSEWRNRPNFNATDEKLLKYYHFVEDTFKKIEITPDKLGEGLTIENFKSKDMNLRVSPNNTNDIEHITKSDKALSYILDNYDKFMEMFDKCAETTFEKLEKEKDNIEPFVEGVE